MRSSASSAVLSAAIGRAVAAGRWLEGKPNEGARSTGVQAEPLLPRS
jgi:hypothetical protein